GMGMWLMMTSTVAPSRSSMAARPELTDSTVYPTDSRMRRKTRATAGSSSTTRMRAFAGSAVASSRTRSARSVIPGDGTLRAAPPQDLLRRPATSAILPPMWHALTPSELGFTNESPFRFENEAVAEAPPDRVFAVLADAPGWPRWCKDFKKAEWTTAAPPGVGSTREVKMRDGLGARERMLAWEPGRRFAFSVDELTRPL